jgi:hypothetical protein
MALIKQKKKVVAPSASFFGYLSLHGRAKTLPIRYADLKHYSGSVTLYDKAGKDTLWSTVLYGEAETAEVHEWLRRTYALLKGGGEESLMRHLYVERIDLCEYGNTQPFRVKIVNRFNENYDYFYVKQPDANRLLGLELEHLLSPNRINYLVYAETIVEEHIVGIPGEIFIDEHLGARYLNGVRLAKEFIKFNERCFVRLLGDMHCHNFVVEIMPDFDEVQYRIRAIDFDQQSYEGSRKVYLPQYHKENNPIILLGMAMKPEATMQYQNEERAVMRYRVQSERQQLAKLLEAVAQDSLAPPDHTIQLAQELADYYEDPYFLTCGSMAALLSHSLNRLFQ